MDIFERESFEFEIDGRSFRIEEFAGLERRRYSRKLMELHERTKTIALQELEASAGDTGRIDFARISECVLLDEEDFVAWLLNLASSDEVSPEWVRDHVSSSMSARIFAKVDELNRMGEHVGNVFGRLANAQAAMTLSGIGSLSATQ